MVDVAPVLEAQPLVVRADARIVPLTVEAEEPASCGSGLRVGPVDERDSQTAAGEPATNRELVQGRGVRRPLTPERRVVPEQREGRRDLAVALPDGQRSEKRRVGKECK